MFSGRTVGRSHHSRGVSNLQNTRTGGPLDPHARFDINFAGLALVSRSRRSLRRAGCSARWLGLHNVGIGELSLGGGMGGSKLTASILTRGVRS